MMIRLKSPHFALFLVVLSLLLSPAAVNAQETTPTVLWQYMPADGAVFGRALSDDGADLVVVIGYGFDPGGTIASLDPATGAVRWSVAIPESPWSDPIIEDGVVYAGIGTLVSGQSAVYAFDAASGNQLWRTDVSNRDLPATPVDGLALGGGTLFVNRGDGVVLALDAGTGSERWEVQLDKPQRGAPFVDGDLVFVSTGFDGARIHAFNVATGDERWSIEEPENPVTGPVVANGLMYVTSIDGNLVAYDPATGEERWRAVVGLVGVEDATPPTPGLPLVADGVVYVSGDGFSGAATLAFDANTGDQLWLAETGEFSASAPALDGGVLLVGSDSGDLLGIDAATGVELWRLAIPNKIDIDLNRASPPLVGGDRIYGVDDTGGFFALEFGGSAAERTIRGN